MPINRLHPLCHGWKPQIETRLPLRYRCNPAFLTRQRFSPKLRLTKHMAVNRANGRLIGLLLLMVFLGAQIHFLSDLDSGQVGAHLCPICSVLSFAILLALPILCCLPVMGRAEQTPAFVLATQGISRSTSPRAPPAL